jgi:hypothetical protein
VLFHPDLLDEDEESSQEGRLWEAGKRIRDRPKEVHGTLESLALSRSEKKEKIIQPLYRKPLRRGLRQGI